MVFPKFLLHSGVQCLPHGCLLRGRDSHGDQSGLDAGRRPSESYEGDSWSKPTTPDTRRGAPSHAGRRRRKESQEAKRKPKEAADPPEDPPSGDDGGEDGSEGFDNSSAATSEIRSMLRRRMKKDDKEGGRPRSSLGSVKIEEFYGDRSRYVKWKRAIEAQQHLYGLEEGELAMLVYLSTKREARDVVEQYPISSYTGSGGLQLLWKALDEGFGESEAELFERADRELERCRKAAR